MPGGPAVARARRTLRGRACDRGGHPLDARDRRRGHRLAARMVAADVPRPRPGNPRPRGRVGRRHRVVAHLRRADGGRGRLSGTQRYVPRLGRPSRRGFLVDLAAARRSDRRSPRVGEQPMGHRRRAAQLRRAPVDAPRHGGCGGAPVAASDADAARARRLRTLRRDVGQGLERTRSRGGARRRLPARPNARRPARSSRARSPSPPSCSPTGPSRIRSCTGTGAPGRGMRSTLRTSSPAGRTHRSSRRTRSRSSCRSPSSGRFAVRRPWPVALVLGLLLVNPVFYSFFANTAEHPRFLYASLPGAVHAVGRRDRAPLSAGPCSTPCRTTSRTA